MLEGSLVDLLAEVSDQILLKVLLQCSYYEQDVQVDSGQNTNQTFFSIKFLQITKHTDIRVFQYSHKSEWYHYSGGRKPILSSNNNQRGRG